MFPAPIAVPCARKKFKKSGGNNSQQGTWAKRQSEKQQRSASNFRQAYRHFTYKEVSYRPWALSNRARSDVIKSTHRGAKGRVRHEVLLYFVVREYNTSKETLTVWSYLSISTPQSWANLALFGRQLLVWSL